MKYLVTVLVFAVSASVTPAADISPADLVALRKDGVLTQAEFAKAVRELNAEAYSKQLYGF